MSHSSKLMTLDAMISDLAALRQHVDSVDITVYEYLSLFDLFDEVSKLKESLGNLRLSVEVGSAQQGDSINVAIERTPVPLNTGKDGSLPSYTGVIHPSRIQWDSVDYINYSQRKKEGT